MRYTIIALGILMLLATTLIACTGTETIPAEGREVKVDGGSYRDIAPEQLTLMLKDKDFPLVNVHIPYEEELPETDMFVPYNEVEKNISLFPEDGGPR
jgi:hypothetical protein